MKFIPVPVLGLLLVILFINFASAATIEEEGKIYAIDCEINHALMTSLSCTDLVTASCTVSVNYGDESIEDVLFIMGGDTIEGDLISGNNTNGSWSGTISVADYAGIGTLGLDKVIIRTSANRYCQGDERTTESRCLIEFTDNRYIMNTCECEWTTTTGTPQIDNSIEFTRIPGPGCADNLLPVTYTEFWDYCDPGWTAKYTACEGTNISDPYRPFDGSMTKYYVAEDPLCGTVTQDDLWFNHNTGSDRTPPLDHNQELACTLGTWLQGQNQGAREGVSSGEITAFNTESNTKRILGKESTYQPLVADFNGDGFVEVVSMSGAELRLTTAELAEVDVIYRTGNDSFIGQPAIWGITGNKDNSALYNPNLELSTEYTIHSDVVQSGTPFVVVGDYFGGTGYIRKYDISTDNFVLNGSVALPGGEKILGGVSCFRDYCWFATDGGAMYRYDVVANTLISDSFQKEYVDPSWTVSSRLTAAPIYENMIPTIVADRNADPDVRQIAWTQYARDGLYTVEGYVLITEMDLTPITGIAMDSRVTYVGPAQYSYEFGGNVAAGGTNIFLTAKEIFDKGGNETGLALTYYRASTNQLLEEVRVSPQTLFVGLETDSDEGISNVVIAAGEPTMMISTLTESESTLGTTGFNPPVLAKSRATGHSGTTPVLYQTFQWDEEYNHLAIGRTGYGTPGIYFQNPGLEQYPISTYSYVDCGYACSFGASPLFNSDSSGSKANIYFDEDHERVIHLYRGVNCGNFGCAASQRALRVTDFSDIGTPVTTTIGIGYTSSAGPFPPYPSEGYLAIASGNLREYNRFNLTDNSLIDSLTTGAQQNYVYRESLDGLAILPNGIVQSMSDSGDLNFVAFGSAGATNNGRYISGRAFNYQPEDMRYISTAGYKVKILSTDPVIVIETQTSCRDDDPGFVALYYNGDDHILGFTTITNNNQGPTWAYCDFSDEANPKVYPYAGQYILHRGYTEAGGVYTYTAPYYGVTETTPGARLNDGHLFNGEGDFRVEMSGCEGAEQICSAGDGDDFYVNAYELDTTRTAPTSQAVVISRIFSINQNNLITYSASFPYASIGPLTVADHSGAGRGEVFYHSGIVNMYYGTYQEFNFGTSQKDEYVVPVDLNADGFIDVLNGRPGQPFLNAWFSSPDVSGLEEGSPEIVGLRCTALPDTGIVNIGIVGRLPNPESASIGIDPGDGTGMDFPDLQTDGVYSYQYTKDGTYEIEVQLLEVTNVSTFQQATCEVEVTVPASTTTTTTSCSLGLNGEFNYIDQISAHKWYGVDSDDDANIYPNNGWLNLNNKHIGYTLKECAYSAATISFRLSTNDELDLQINDENDASKVLGLTVSNDENAIKLFSGESLLEYNGEIIDVDVIIDRANGRQRIYVDDQLMYSTTESVNLIGGIRIKGTGDIDYVRIVTSGNKQTLPPEEIDAIQNLDGDESYLLNCDSGALAAEEDLEDRRRYTNLLLFCGSTTTGYCDYSALQKIASAYESCTKEVFNYCVYDAYPREEGVVESEGLTGGTTCSALLSSSSFFSGIVKPSVNIAWTTISSNAITALLILLLLVVIIPFATRRR